MSRSSPGQRWLVQEQEQQLPDEKTSAPGERPLVHFALQTQTYRPLSDHPVNAIMYHSEAQEAEVRGRLQKQSKSYLHTAYNSLTQALRNNT